MIERLGPALHAGGREMILPLACIPRLSPPTRSSAAPAGPSGQHRFSPGPSLGCALKFSALYCTCNPRLSWPYWLEGANGQHGFRLGTSVCAEVFYPLLDTRALPSPRTNILVVIALARQRHS